MPTPSTTTLHDLFLQALDLSHDHRPAFLNTACGNDRQLRAAVESLLTAHERAGAFLSSPEFHPPAGRLPLPSTIGPYTLRKILGEGGYGVVYLAEQGPPLRRLVALKLIKAGMDTRQVIARFDLERQALALMNHPHIARVLDAGASLAGHPYFVMEYVDGKPLTEFARERRLSIPVRLALFLQVCSAVEHAHQKGILHRDLKPANVLVAIQNGKPLAKVIDFGIAKALSSANADWRTPLTETPQLLGTPQYMSPEQASAPGGDIDSRTDVYSLGVLLYELLAGSPPFDPKQLRAVHPGEIHRILREVDPLTPSAALLKLSQTLLAGSPTHAKEVRQLAHQVRGDLDWIVMKAMEKDRARRYDSVEMLAHDIKRFLRNEPVLAASQGWRYRTRKFLRRHRRTLALVTGGFLALFTGFFAALWFNAHTHPASSTASPAAASQLAPPAPTAPPSPTAGLRPGLLARIYSGSEFQHFVTSRIDPSIDRSWGRGHAPAPGVTAPHYSIRWEGILVIPPQGVDEMEFWIDDGGSVFVDGAQILNAENPGTFAHSVQLAPGRHVLQVDYWNRLAQGHVQLRWRPVGGQVEPIPADAFYHPEAATQPAP